MGMLRFLLSLSVVAEHAPPYWQSPVGAFAVPLFYVISGYLMSYILVESQSYLHPRDFYFSRVLRLFPLYYVAVFLIMISWYFEPYNWGQFGSWPTALKVYSIVANAAIFSQDWAYLLGVRDGALQFTLDFKNSDIRVWESLIDSPSWTLAVELSFYLLAPFIVGRKILVWTILFASLSLRLVVLRFVPQFQLAYTYNFFPFELSTFMLGVLSHQYISPWAKRIRAKSNISQEKRMFTPAVTVTALTIILAMIFTIEPLQRASIILSYPLLTRFFATVLLALAAPFLFKFQQQFAWDRSIGNLSYPVYIMHRFLIILVHTFLGFNYPTLQGGWFAFLCIVLLTLALAWTSHRLVEIPIDRFRARFQVKGQ